ncbi:MAG: M1 family aminopeptidase [Bacteroidales bacterium]|nr:M1 family aminopeptidase [Bacteroidales bacterium]
MSVPENKDLDIESTLELRFHLGNRQDVILDFCESPDKIHEIIRLSEKGKKPETSVCKWECKNGHLVIPRQYACQGENAFIIRFTAGNQGLNRRDGYIYSLFVPDRAHTVFPCFDQPNLKARFSLELEIPENWKVAQNGVQEECSQQVMNPGRKVVKHVLETPIPTYLFAFAAGEFQYQLFSEGNKTIGAFYRETDSLRIAQLPEIMHQVVFSLNWLEDFTGLKYPFPKYDLVILPGFQFGGMEHVGATFYNDNTLFLSANPTPDELLARTQLISHETAHMWFGDAVTMDWFNDVWTKEVFANYFAAEITEPMFPDIDHNLNWLKRYQAAAIAQDRTEGRTSIRQPLDNMKNAGLIYNNIIYNKAPVMMRKMVQMMGKEAFRRGIQQYVKQYLYDNATWDDLIAILDRETPEDLKSFSLDWVDTPMWPHYWAASWDDARIGDTYGFFELKPLQADSLMNRGWQSFQGSGAQRQALLMNLYENYLAKTGNITDEAFACFLIKNIEESSDPLLCSTMLSYLSLPLESMTEQSPVFERELWSLAQNHSRSEVRTGILRLLVGSMQSVAMVDSMYLLWQKGESSLLSINDFNTLTYELAIRMPEKADSLVAVQKERNTNPDRRKQFEYVARAVSPSAEERDRLFASLEKPENRRIEPWTLSLLYYLNHPLREEESVKYIRPALEWIWDIQKTGDIFFPANWCARLLSGHRSKAAYEEVEAFLADHPDMLPLLRNKVLSAEYYLKRANK